MVNSKNLTSHIENIKNQRPHLLQEDKQRGMLLQHLLLKVTIFPSKVLQDPEHLQFYILHNVKRSAGCNDRNHGGSTRNRIMSSDDDNINPCLFIFQ